MRRNLLGVKDGDEEIPDIGTGRSGHDRVSGSGKSTARIKSRKRGAQIAPTSPSMVEDWMRSPNRSFWLQGHSSNVGKSKNGD